VNGTPETKRRREGDGERRVARRGWGEEGGEKGRRTAD